MNACMEMPRYRCHKEVRALKIAAVIRVLEPAFSKPVCRGCVALNSACGHCERCLWRAEHNDPGYVIIPEDQNCARFCVDKQYIAKHNPQPGGYYVVYDDGYKSFSPAQAFEEGYSKL